ncbi:1,4-dihydroxy-2-naphthoate octaprenyltransferase [uncultured Lamprocystis sp.]|jgi:1,4-dihydroxy-2-naphthoate octaprenyltransferase|uniref:1,4-dihydroxy-2-naphthoate octaprenyltransferase n=1 Tax=uncultured Lamprocystis sp. TaxID=543132 RepID=UPI0025F698CE|nr:1,4-dihydroxy-2-naphthoate octaprenyltransferase [uncultured Lamprocystis sp.]
MQQDTETLTVPLDLEPTDRAAAGASAIGRWVAAARPKTLLLAATPVLAGIALAAITTGTLAPLVAAATLLAALAIQVGTNLHNDAADFERGTDTPDRVGPPRATAQGWFTARQVRAAAHLTFGIAFALGLLLVARGGWPIFLVGVAALASGYGYTSGPRPIAYGPFGELYVLAFFGITAVAGSYYLQTLTLDWPAVTLGLALGLPAAAVLLLNNYRDLETDVAAGRRTLCDVLGRPRARVLYALLMLLPPLPLLLGAGLPGATWLTLGALPLGLLLTARLYQGAQGAQINPMLGQTGLYQGLLTLLMIVGFAFGGGA